jgi:hypothetical protein
MSASPKNVRNYLLVIRCGEVVKEVPFQKNRPPLRYRRKVGGATAPAHRISQPFFFGRVQMLPKKIAHNMNDPCLPVEEPSTASIADLVFSSSITYRRGRSA